MTILIIGVLLWTFVHLFPSLMPNARANAIAALGNNTYRGLFALAIVISLVGIVVGWRTADIQPIYAPPLYGSIVVTVLMFASFVLFAAANAPGNIKRYLRHPMLTGALVWGIAHLLANGDKRSLVLFGGIGLWSLISIILISRREGEWQRPAAVSAAKDAMTIIGSAVIFGIVIYLHKFLFGVSSLPGI